MRVMLVDNYDSFTHNRAHAIAEQGHEVAVARNDALDVAGLLALRPAAIVLSPGPGTPAEPRDVGVCGPLLASRAEVPLLGVCLGMQAMAHFTGGRVVRAPRPVHGEASDVALSADPLFEGLGPRIAAGRYHSLAVEEAGLPAEWSVIARGDGVAMAMAHRDLPWWGVQFHPESILTPEGPRILRNFLRLAGAEGASRFA
jgi:anthranilate synthase component 2